VEIVLVRHALPLRVDATPDDSPADPGLAPLGHEQAATVVAALAGQDVAALYTSPAARARETAAPLEQALSMTAGVEPGVAEFDLGESSYVPIEELKAAGDPRYDALVRGDLYSAGIDPVAFRRTVVEAVERLAAAHPGERVVVFSHAGAINAAAGGLLAQERTIWFAPAYCSLTRLAYSRGGRRSVVSLNEVGHVRSLLG